MEVEVEMEPRPYFEVAVKNNKYASLKAGHRT